jgi:hypothetical protein
MARALLVLLLLLPLPAAAQPATVPAAAAQSTSPLPVPARPMTVAGSFLEGAWALRLDGAVIMRFDLQRKGDAWAGAWVKPTSLRADSNGRRFGDIVMPAVDRKADSGRAIGDWAEIVFNDPRPGEEPDVFRFRLLSADRAEMLYVGTGMAPFTLERVTAGASLGPFEPGGIYDDQPGTGRVAARPAAAVPPPLGQTSVQPPARVSPAPQTAPVQGPADNRRPAMTGR